MENVTELFHDFAKACRDGGHKEQRKAWLKFKKYFVLYNRSVYPCQWLDATQDEIDAYIEDKDEKYK